tara:strand:- start:572 stop:847 length:276 start_codon:yes stop_codon:yes gene_type:complete
MEIAVFLLLVSMGISSEVKEIKTDLTDLQIQMVQMEVNLEELTKKQSDNFISLAAKHSAFSARSEVHDERHDRRLKALEDYIKLLEENPTQ